MREAWDVIVFQYVDDLIILHSSSEVLREITQRAIRFLQWLGWTVNMEKSMSIPAQTFEYLGMEWNTKAMMLQLTVEKNKQLKKRNRQWIKRVEKGETVTVHQFASMIGSLSATRVQHRQASLYLTTIYRILSDTTRREGWQGSIVLSRQLLPQLHW
jgi:antitoxin (DNA-binding transcriptional repressor) of toxin-antitoxin stability system